MGDGEDNDMGEKNGGKDKKKAMKMKNFGRRFWSLGLHLHPSDLSFCVLV